MVKWKPINIGWVGVGYVTSPILSTHYCMARTVHTAFESTTSPHWDAAVGINFMSVFKT